VNVGGKDVIILRADDVLAVLENATVGAAN
jgi:co-chaperonin GroES (HSP10)